MEKRTTNFVECKINNINLKSPFENIQLNMSRGTSYFEGRTQILQNIKYHFIENENKMVVIHGAPGFGKTETALQFAIKNSHYYRKNLIWIFAETQDNIEKCFRDLASNLNLGSPDVSQIYGKFESTRCLFIFDNVENMSSIRRYLPVPQLHSTVDILITSQFSQWDSSVYKVPLEPLNVEDSLKIFQSKLGDKYGEYKVQIWKNLVDYLEGIPLSLQVVSSLINVEFSQVHFPKFNVEKYIEDLKEQFINAKIPESDINSYNKTVFSSIRFAVDRLTKKDNCHAFDVLGLLAYSYADFTSSLDLILLPSLEKSEEKLGKALTELENISLIQVERCENPLRIKIHRTIQLVLRKYDLNEQNGLMFKTALRRAVLTEPLLFPKCVFYYVNEFKDKLLEFCNENKTQVTNLLLHLVRHDFNVILKELLPKIKEEYCETEQIINEVLKWAIKCFYRKDMSIIQLLIETYGAKIEVSNRKNAFHCASRWLSIDLFKYLLEHSDHESVINSKDFSGNTILHLLVEDCDESNFENTIECMEYLISKWKADILIPGFCNFTILHTAFRSQNFDFRLIKYLTEVHNCKDLVNTQNNNGDTPLEMFCRYIDFREPDSFELLSYLLKDCKADISITDHMGCNAFFYICSSGTFEIIDFVMSEGYCRQIINNQDMFGNVAFAKLIENRYIRELKKIKLIDLFIKNNMNFKIKNNMNKTLVEIAKEEDLLKLSNKLKKYM